VADLAAAGVGARFDVAVACPSSGELRGAVQAAGAEWIPLELRRQPGPWDAVAVAGLRRVARGHDVIHLHSSKAGAVGRLALAGLRHRPASVFTPHGWSWLAANRAGSLYRQVERALAPMADVIIAVSREEQAAGRQALGRGGSRIRLIENGVDTDRYRPDGPRAPRSEAPLIVCLGRLSYQKGQDIAVRALAQMHTPGVRLRLVGDGPDRGELARLAASLGVAERLELTGEVAEPAPHLRAADVVVVPARWDGLSLALLEAMGCGAPIVATRVSGAATLEGAGVLISVDDPPALAAAVDDLLGDRRRARHLGDEAADRVARQFTLARSAERHMELWTELAGRR
jgi:glycosyltransferase involved in cell wall biosynthesis